METGHVHAAWVATERLGAVRAVLAEVAGTEGVECVPMIATPSWSAVLEPESAILRIVSAHLDHRGPVSARALAGELGLPVADIVDALLALEADGAILRGSFTASAPPAARGAVTAREAIAAADDSAALRDIEWCNRRVLARIHRLTLARLRKEIEPVSAAALMRFLLRWQRVGRHAQLIGADGLLRIVEQLQGFETAAGAWEREVLPARLHGYDQTWLDQLCLAGQVVWCRLSPRRPAADAEPAAGAEHDSDDNIDNESDNESDSDRDSESDDEHELGVDREATRVPVPAAAATGRGERIRSPADRARELYNLAEAGAEAARLAGGTRDQIAAAATAAITGQCSRHDASVVVSLVTMSAMLRRGSEGREPPSTSSQSARLTAALERAHSRGERADPHPASRTRGPRDDQAAIDRTRVADRHPRDGAGPADALAAQPRPARCAPSRSAPLALILRRDATWLRAAAAVGQGEPPALGPQAVRLREHLASHGASFLVDLVTTIDLLPDEIEDALWELVAAGLATADGFASLRVLVSRRRGEVKSHFDRMTATAAGATPVRKWQDAIRKARTRDRERPGHALRSLPTAAGRWSLLPSTDAASIDAEASARQLLHRYGVVFRDLLLRESSLPPWRDLLVALRRLEARGEIRGGRFVTGFVGEQFALPEALDELRAARNPGPSPETCRVAATDPTNLVGILSPGPRVPAIVGNMVLYLDGHAVASLEGGRVVVRAAIPPGARIDDDLTYHPPPRPVAIAAQAPLPL